MLHLLWHFTEEARATLAGNAAWLFLFPKPRLPDSLFVPLDALAKSKKRLEQWSAEMIKNPSPHSNQLTPNYTAGVKLWIRGLGGRLTAVTSWDQIPGWAC